MGSLVSTQQRILPQCSSVMGDHRREAFLTNGCTAAYIASSRAGLRELGFASWMNRVSTRYGRAKLRQLFAQVDIPDACTSIQPFEKCFVRSVQVRKRTGADGCWLWLAFSLDD